MTHEENLEILAHEICGKPGSVSLETCHGTWGRSKPLCSDYDGCRILEKSVEQIAYVLSSNAANTFLLACPGSGKTEVVGLKAAYSIHTWRGHAGGIAVLTFTNNAATVITQRVDQFSGVVKTGYPHFIGTIDSWLHGYIANPFAYLMTGYPGRNDDHSIRIVDEYDDGGWLNAYRVDTPFVYFRKVPGGTKTTASIPLYANKVRFDHEADKWEIKNPASEIGDYLVDEDYYSSEAFTSFRKDKAWLSLERMRNGIREKKNLFNRAGFATYQDVESLCFQIVRDNTAICHLMACRFPLVVVDECQDLSWIQLQILDKLREQGTILHFVGDLNQAIYEFKKVDPQKVNAFTEDRHFTVLPLTTNFRSCQPIVDICQRIVRNNGQEKAACKQLIEGLPCICVLYTESQMHLLPNWFKEYLSHIPCDKDKSAIVTRNWNNVSRLRPSACNIVKGPPKTLAAAIHLWESHQIQSIDDSLRYMGRFITDKYFAEYSCNPRLNYCPECIDSPLRWRLFLSRVLESCSEDACPMSDLDQAWSLWAPTVRSQFGNVIRSLVPKINDESKNLSLEFPDLDGSTFKTPKGETDNNVLGTLPIIQKLETNIRITTIHSVKGETLDAILLVSAPNKQGTGHWTQWLADPQSEAARLAYVASSRPKHLLAWAIPKPSGQDSERIRNLGFQIIEMTDD